MLIDRAIWKNRTITKPTVSLVRILRYPDIQKKLGNRRTAICAVSIWMTLPLQTRHPFCHFAEVSLGKTESHKLNSSLCMCVDDASAPFVPNALACGSIVLPGFVIARKPIRSASSCLTRSPRRSERREKSERRRKLWSDWYRPATSKLATPDLSHYIP